MNTVDEEEAAPDAKETDELDEVVPAVIDQAAGPEADGEPPVERGRRLSLERAKNVIESLLFVAEAPLTVHQIQEVTGLGRDQVMAALEKLAAVRREGVSGIVLQEVAGGFQFRTDPGSAQDVRRFLKVKPQRLTRAALETLAIIAYRQPVTRPEVEDVRGVDSGAVIKALLERKLLKILGKKEEVGRPILYGTSREFLEFFALRDLASLPTLREFQELSAEHQEIVERDTSDAAPAVSGTVEALSDPAFVRVAAERQRSAESALVELERAMAVAEERARRTSATLGPAQG